MLIRLSALRQTVTDAKHWHQKFIKHIETQLDERSADAKRTYEGKVHEAQYELWTEIQAIQAAVTKTIVPLGLIAAPWNSVNWNQYKPTLRGMVGADALNEPGVKSAFQEISDTIPGGVRVGSIDYPLEKELMTIPALVPIIGRGHLFIVTEGNEKNRATELLQSVATRILTTFPALSVRALFIDPVGLGDNFPFKRLPETIRGSTVYSEADEIQEQMRELNEHIRRVAQRYLARDYQNIEDYNRDAGEVVEPYRFLFAADFPTKFSEDSATRLLSIAERGVRTGVYMAIHINANAEMPRNFDLQALLCTGSVIHVKDGEFMLTMPDKERQFSPDSLPPDMLFNSLLNAVNQASQFGGFQGIPFERILPPREEWWKGSTIQRIEAPIGRTGARDPLMFWLGRSRDGRIAAHALIGGQTGSGKSTLFHVLINSLLVTYPPEELQLYLLDYKEGVEFKPYADAKPPHIREVSPHLDRPAGLRILNELQRELEQRGEQFKAANVQDLSDFRLRTGEPLPRLLLIIDEFQKLFEVQDEIATKSGQILEDLARRGRAFGIHIIMGSQSIHISNISTTVYSQFVTRIALQSPEADIAALLGSDNTDAASILDRPGEVIYNDGGGLRERNTPGQVALLREAAIPRILALINSLAKEQ